MNQFKTKSSSEELMGAETHVDQCVLPLLFSTLTFTCIQPPPAARRLVNTTLTKNMNR